MKAVTFHPSARAELDASADFYEARLSGLGLRFLVAVEETTKRIGESPGAGTAMAGGFRKRLVPGFPFSIIYRWKSSPSNPAMERPGFAGRPSPSRWAVSGAVLMVTGVPEE